VIEHGLPLIHLGRSRDEPYVSLRSGRLGPAPARERSVHAVEILAQIDSLDQQLSAIGDRALPGNSGSLVTATGPDLGNPSVSKQLRNVKGGADVLNVSEGRAVVHLRGDLSALRAKVVAYASEDTPLGAPRFNALIARIESIDSATIEDLSLGELRNDLPDDERLWIEVWMRGGSGVDEEVRAARDEAVRTFAALAHPDNPELAVLPVYRGRERDIHLVQATGELIKAIPLLLPEAAEVHLAPMPRAIELAEAADEQGQDVEVVQPTAEAPAVVLHDSGIDADHPYLASVLLGTGSVVPGAPIGDDSADGHGTQMAGVAAYSQLAAGVAAGSVEADAWLVSIRLLESETEAGGDPDRGALWAERTVEAVRMAEALAPGRQLIHNFSIGADNPRDGQRIDRTAWSIAADDLAWNSGQGRLLVVAAGNAEPIVDPANYPAINLGPPHHQQPGQAWNALTVGGYTDLATLTQKDEREGYSSPLAGAGMLSPHSRTASVGNKPLKPDIVMEAGNTAPGGGLDSPDAQGLTILTASRGWRVGGSSLRRTWATSPAAASASNALARLAGVHPSLRAATHRALLTHTAHWPDAARAQFQAKRDLIRAFGYGVAEPVRAFGSDSNRPVMVYEGAIRPKMRLPGGVFERRADFIELPLPFEELDQLGSSLVTVAVTLSYFIEPTENLTRRDYAGARLRWDLQGPAEEEHGFRARVNKLVRDQGVEPGPGSYDWEIGTDLRSRGTLQHDRAIVAASAVAGSRLLAVQPVLGWWEDSVKTATQLLRYSLVVSVDLGEVDVELFALVESGILSIDSSVSAT
jgi:Subtilase family